MDLIVLLVILGGVLFEVESFGKAGKYINSGGGKNCKRIYPGSDVNYVQCLKDLPFRCKNNFANPHCNTDDTGYEFNKDTGKCYKLHVDKKIWIEGLFTCHSEEAYLAIANSNAEAKHFADLIRTIEKKDFAFIGFHDRFESGFYMDMKGKLLSDSGYMKWNEDEPNSNKGNCGAINWNGFLLMEDCYESEKVFICERDV